MLKTVWPRPLLPSVRLFSPPSHLFPLLLLLAWDLCLSFSFLLCISTAAFLLVILYAARLLSVLSLFWKIANLAAHSPEVLYVWLLTKAPPTEMFSFVRNGKNVLVFWYLWEDLFNLEAEWNLADTHMNSQDELIIYLLPELQWRTVWLNHKSEISKHTHKNMLIHISLKVLVVQLTGEIKQRFQLQYTYMCVPA